MTFIFLGEMGLKLWGLGVRNYIRNRLNCFDCFITLLSLIQYLLGATYLKLINKLNLRNDAEHPKPVPGGEQSVAHHTAAAHLRVHEGDPRNVPKLLPELHQHP